MEELYPDFDSHDTNEKEFEEELNFWNFPLFEENDVQQNEAPQMIANEEENDVQQNEEQASQYLYARFDIPKSIKITHSEINEVFMKSEAAYFTAQRNRNNKLTWARIGGFSKLIQQKINDMGFDQAESDINKLLLLELGQNIRKDNCDDGIVSFLKTKTLMGDLEKMHLIAFKITRYMKRSLPILLYELNQHYDDMREAIRKYKEQKELVQ